MLAAGSLKKACPGCRARIVSLASNTRSNSSFPVRPTNSPRPTGQRNLPSLVIRQSAGVRTFSVSRVALQKTENQDDINSGAAAGEDIETIVREAKQRFRDTLPKGYLTEEEYKLYERWYGPPLRETQPEDVGIPFTREDAMASPPPAQEGSAEEALLREVESGHLGQYVDTAGSIVDMEDVGPEDLAESLELDEDSLTDNKTNFINVVARNKREYDALVKLQKDFEAASLLGIESEETSSDRDAWAVEEALEDEELDMDEEYQDEDGGYGDRRSGRLHPLTIEGQFSTHPSTLNLPQHGFVSPIQTLLRRTDVKHVREAAETAFGGPGLPYSPATPASKKDLPMRHIGMEAGQHKMSEIEADAYIATFLPTAYASVMSALVEVRKRLGADWMRNLIGRADGQGPRVLDAGAGGAGLVAWQKVLEAEWNVLREKGEISNEKPPGKKSVIIGSEPLRNRVSSFLHNTTFLPRLPDYAHSVDNADQLLDGPEVPQSRKTYDIIIATHMLLPIKEGHRRKAVLNNLWSLLSPEGGVLIVMEKGHPRGFEAVAEVRDRLLQEFFIPPSGSEPPVTGEIDTAYERVREPGMIIAPCTNHRTCPMYVTAGKSHGRKDFCHFSQRFERPPFLQRILGATHRNHDDVQFSYIAIQRGAVAKDGPLAGDEATEQAFAGFEKSPTSPDMLSLPRNILPPIKRRGHVTFDLCTPAGHIERWTIPKSHSKQAYHDARKTKWGDLWALGAKTRVRRAVRLGKPESEDDGGVRAQRAKQAMSKKPRVINLAYDQDGITSAKAAGHLPAARRTKGGKKPRNLLKDLLSEE